MNELELLRAYKLQNPRKYQLKYGDKSPEEVADKVPPIRPTVINGVKIDMGAKTEKEMEFKDDISGFTPEGLKGVTVTEDLTVLDKPKRGKKKNG